MAFNFPIQESKGEQQQFELFKQKINANVVAESESKTKDEIITTYIKELFTPFTDFKAQHLKEILLLLAKPVFLEEFNQVLQGYIDFKKRRSYGETNSTEFSSKILVSFISENKQDKAFINHCGYLIFRFGAAHSMYTLCIHIIQSGISGPPLPEETLEEQMHNFEIFKKKFTDHIAQSELKTEDEFISTYIKRLFTPLTDFKAEKLSEILMLLAKPEFSEEFNQVLLDYLNFYKKEHQSCLEPMPPSSSYEESMKRDREINNFAISKLISFIEHHKAKANDVFIPICGNFLLNFAARRCIPDICEYLIKKCHVSPNGIKFKELSPQLSSSTLLHNLRNPFGCIEIFSSYLSLSLRKTWNEFFYL